LFIVNDIEMGIERGRFVNGGHGQIHEGRKSPETGHGQIPVGILKCMKVLEQAISASQRRINTFVTEQAPQL
jgi:hypothetical protein